jgi:hypothetical protein
MNPYWLVVAFTLLTQFYLFVRWLHRRVRDNAIEREFIHDMATNHLPHIYHALRQMADHHGLSLQEPPPLRFLEFGGPESHRR